MNKDIFWNVTIGVLSAVLIGGGAYVMMTGGILNNKQDVKAEVAETTNIDAEIPVVDEVGTNTPSQEVKNDEIKKEEVNKAIKTIKSMMKDGVKIDIEKEGAGAAITNGQNAVVHYTGKLTDGKIFDSSIPRNQPFIFQLGSGMVIKGWETGVLGMKKGEKRILTIPPEMGYGAAGAGGVIPPNSTLVFEVELMDIK